MMLVAIDPARQLNNGQPSGLCRWIDALDLSEGETVVHAGCGTGYYTALMAHMVGPTGHVTAIELDRDPQNAQKGTLPGCRGCTLSVAMQPCTTQARRTES